MLNLLENNNKIDSSVALSTNNNNIWEIVTDESLNTINVSKSLKDDFQLTELDLNQLDEFFKEHIKSSLSKAINDSKESFFVFLPEYSYPIKFLISNFSCDEINYFRILSFKEENKNNNVYKSIFESFYDVYYRTDRTGKLILISPSVKDRAGYEPKELTGSNVKNFFRKIKDWKNLLKLLRKDGSINKFETQFSKADGSICYVSMDARYYYNEENEIEGIEGVLRDITERVEIEDNINTYIQELYESKDIIEQNAFELVKLNLQLEESELKLQELNANKDKFFSIISHDLKNPFSTLLGYTEMLFQEFDDMDNEELKSGISSIYKAAKSTYELLSALLDWSRVQSGRMDFEPIGFSIYDTVNDLSQLNELSAAKKKISIINNVENDIKVFADPNMISTIIRNLITNALKFTQPDGSITISSNILNDLAVICVEDTGLGMNKEALEKLFRIDIHFTTNGTNNEKGTGLGLILCKDLIEKNKGKIWVESEPNIGSKFFISIPLSKSSGDVNAEL